MLQCHLCSLDEFVELSVANLSIPGYARILIFGTKLPHIILPSLSVDKINSMKYVEVILVNSLEEINEIIFQWIIDIGKTTVIALYGVITEFMQCEKLPELFMLLYNVKLKMVDIYFGEKELPTKEENNYTLLEKWIAWN